jgi:hypothetical protein
MHDNPPWSFRGDVDRIDTYSSTVTSDFWVSSALSRGRIHVQTINIRRDILHFEGKSMT